MLRFGVILHRLVPLFRVHSVLTDREGIPMGITSSDAGFWLITAAGVASLTATLVLLARWPRMRLRQR
jgi:hypothetical protein